MFDECFFSILKKSIIEICKIILNLFEISLNILFNVSQFKIFKVETELFEFLILFLLLNFSF